jgi:hypothetical protein
MNYVSVLSINSYSPGSQAGLVTILQLVEVLTDVFGFSDEHSLGGG